MSIGAKVGYSWYQIGRSDYFASFFGTIAYYLENKKWGSKYPKVMHQLYSGKVPHEEADEVIRELKIIQKELEHLDKFDNPIIWDAQNLSIQTPKWAINPNDNVKTLKNYYVTPDGRDLIEQIMVALQESKDVGADLIIKSLNAQTTSYF